MRGSAAPARPDRSAIRTRRRVHLTMSPAAVWEALHRLDAYRRWWPWLEAFDGLALAPGEQWRTTVRAPFGYRVRFAGVGLDDPQTGPPTQLAVFERVGA